MRKVIAAAKGATRPAVALLVLVLAAASRAQAPPALEIYVIDVEGGQATLVVSPAGESMLVDAGWPGFDGRDADRIATAVKQAGLSHLDYLVVTHYHRDHVGGVPELVTRVPVKTFVDHGPSVETGPAAAALFNAYLEVRKTGHHLQVKPGDVLPMRDVDIRVVASDGELISRPLTMGSSNPLCGSFTPRAPDPGENARSVGLAIGYGAFRMLDLGDLTWNKEHDLVCPTNLLGTFDVYLATHHGTDTSGPAVIVHAIRPRVAVMNNGATKGGSRSAWRIIRDAPGLRDLWQIHHAVAGGADHNSPAPFLANLDETTAHGIRITARPDGSFTVTNDRNGHSRRYAPAKR
ncbi:MAG: ComEC/Rec2 family competence protein [Vicinamibacterales bacterium]